MSCITHTDLSFLVELIESRVVPANQTEENEVRELSGKESGIGSGLLSPKVRELHFLRFGLQLRLQKALVFTTPLIAVTCWPVCLNSAFAFGCKIAG